MANRGITSELPINISHTRSIINSFEQSMRDYSNNAIKVAELKLFVEIHKAAVPEKQRVQTANAISKYREKQWSNALKKAKGNKKKALNIILAQDD